MDPEHAGLWTFSGTCEALPLPVVGRPLDLQTDRECWYQAYAVITR